MREVSNFTEFSQTLRNHSDPWLKWIVKVLIFRLESSSIVQVEVLAPGNRLGVTVRVCSKSPKNLTGISS